MDTRILNSSTDLSVGVVYTPEKWARFAIEKYGLLDAWLSGKTIFDPTMGNGGLLKTLVAMALDKGHNLKQLPISNLFGVEINHTAYIEALETFERKFGIDMRDNFFHTDIFHFGNPKFDVLFGNPPWCNFVDLPKEYKTRLKPLFFEYRLVLDSKKLLLGGSRIDIAALVVQKTIIDNLKHAGQAVFFLPLSLFLNDGAHTAFRHFSAKREAYSLSSIYDFDTLEVFDGIATRYGLAEFVKADNQQSTIPYFRFEKSTWTENSAQISKLGKPLLVSSDAKTAVTVPHIKVPYDAKPRQGVNPCGAINVFVFEEYRDIDKETCKVNNAWLLPKNYVYPLITSRNFRDDTSTTKWVLLPYNSCLGKPLSIEELSSEPLLLRYLTEHKHILENRKGTLIQAHIKRGVWWALLGVGPYSFSQYKIVWEAYGKNTFRPQLFDGLWQANQSLQAFIPCGNQQDAFEILNSLSNPSIEQYLRAHCMDGTMNWAQPGKIASILQFTDLHQANRQQELFV